MRRIRLTRADAAQLREEIASLTGVTVDDADAQGEIFVNVPDDADGVRVDEALRRHFPRSLVRAIADIDFEGATTVAELKARCIEMRNKTVRALRARWE